MLTLLTIVHFVVCVFLIVIVLLQHGKGADMGATFGGGSGKTVFGTEGPLPLLNKITTASAIIFMFTSVILAYYSANMSKKSVMKSLSMPAGIEKKVEIAPKPVEVPLNTAPTVVDDKGAPAQFPGQPAPATPEAQQAKEAAPPAPAEFPGSKSPDAAKEPAPTPAQGQ